MKGLMGKCPPQNFWARTAPEYQHLRAVYVSAVGRCCDCDCRYYYMYTVCNAQIMKTDFVPKLVAAISASCAVYAIVTVADRLLTVRTLASVGYFDALVGVSPLNFL